MGRVFAFNVDPFPSFFPLAFILFVTSLSAFRVLELQA